VETGLDEERIAVGELSFSADLEASGEEGVAAQLAALEEATVLGLIVDAGADFDLALALLVGGALLAFGIAVEDKATEKTKTNAYFPFFIFQNVVADAQGYLYQVHIGIAFLAHGILAAFAIAKGLGLEHVVLAAMDLQTTCDAPFGANIGIEPSTQEVAHFGIAVMGFG
jgi:hypothetical protein